MCGEQSERMKSTSTNREDKKRLRMQMRCKVGSGYAGGSISTRLFVQRGGGKEDRGDIGEGRRVYGTEGVLRDTRTGWRRWVRGNRSRPAAEESHESRSEEDPEDGNGNFSCWRFRHCRRGRASVSQRFWIQRATMSETHSCGQRRGRARGTRPGLPKGGCRHCSRRGYR